MTINTRVQDILMGGLFGLILGVIGNLWVAVFDYLFLANQTLIFYKYLIVLFSFGLLGYIGLLIFYVKKLEPASNQTSKKYPILERLKIFIFSFQFFWILILITIIGLMSVVVFVLEPMGIINFDLRQNLYAEGIGIILTVLIIPILLKYRENTQWKSVKDRVLMKIGLEMNVIFMEFSSLVLEPTMSGVDLRIEGDLFRKAFFSQLESLNKSDEVSLNEIGREVVSKGWYRNHAQRRSQNLSEIESKYSRFLDPNITKGLIQLQTLLNRLHILLQIPKEGPERYRSEEKYHNAISLIILRIIKLIYRAQEYGIIIYF